MEGRSGWMLKVERDSVCAGDDIAAPHEKRFSVAATDTLHDLIMAVISSGYLARITGGQATWIVESADVPLAVVAQQWTSPMFLVDRDTLAVDTIRLQARCPLFFRYWCQVDPQSVFECLKSGRPLPERFR